jgi:hypothetical protein
MDTPMGKVVKNLMDEGATLGVSSRGMGSLKQNKQGIMEVQKDFMLATAGDIVADPSAPDAFVKGIMEGAEWFYDIASGNWMREQAVDQIVTETKKLSPRKLEEQKFNLFAKFLNNISK